MVPFDWVCSFAQAGPPGPPDSLFANPLFMIVMMVVLFYFFLIRPQKKEQKEKDDMRGGLTKNDRVVTSGGLIGTIVNLKNEELTLRIDDQAKVKARFLRSAVVRVLSDTTAKTADVAKKS